MKNYWFEVAPARLEREKEALTAAGIEFKIEETLLKDRGIIRIKFNIAADNQHFDLAGWNEDLVLEAEYPDTYPLFRPNVFAPELNLGRHQNPLEKNLCLLGRSTMEWDSSWTLVQLLQEQLGKVLTKGSVTDPDIIRNDEAEQAEPVSTFYATAEFPLFFDKSTISEIEISEQKAYRIAECTIGITKFEMFPFPMAVLGIKLVGSDQERVLPAQFHEKFKGKLKGQFYYVPVPPPKNPSETLRWLKDLLQENGQVLKLNSKPVEIEKIKISNVTGVCFPEEKEKGKPGLGVLFHVESYLKIQTNNPSRKTLPQKPLLYYASAMDVQPEPANIRAPKLAPLRNKKVSVIGLGALGSFLAIEMGRSGIGKMDILDPDAVELATSIRWPLGLSASGISKAIAVHEFLKQNYPETHVRPIKRNLGQMRPFELNGTRSNISEQDILNDIFDDCSLVIDATTEFGVHHLLAREAQLRGVPYMCLYATPGAYGGSVMRQLPGKTGCWSCFMHMEADESLLKLNEDKTNGTFQPPGCADITFTGAGVDLQQISLMASRMAISTLCKEEKEGYPDPGADIARVNLFDENGKPLAPNWQIQQLSIHPGCHYCNEPL